MYTYGSTVIFLGPPGSGKGTQAALLSAELQIPAVSTGEILRQACHSGSELGARVRSVVEAGQLVGDELMNEVVVQRLLEPDCRDGCILDGYPRTVPQARFLSAWLSGRSLPEPFVVDFRLSPREIIARLSQRRVCGECGRTYGANLQTGAAHLRCDFDGSMLLQRADDRPDVIRGRLELYQQNSEDLLRFFQGPNYFRLTAAGSPDHIFAELMRALGLRRASVDSVRPVTARPAYGV